MSRRFFYTGIILFGGLIFGAAPALAMGDTMEVTAVVVQTRVIILDSNGDILKVVGNTAQNIAPVVEQNGRVKPINARIAAQYDSLLGDNGGSLEAGKTYFSAKYDPYRQLAAWLLTSPVFSGRLY